MLVKTIALEYNVRTREKGSLDTYPRFPTPSP